LKKNGSELFVFGFTRKIFNLVTFSVLSNDVMIFGNRKQGQCLETPRKTQAEYNGRSAIEWTPSVFYTQPIAKTATEAGPQSPLQVIPETPPCFNSWRLCNWLLIHQKKAEPYGRLCLLRNSNYS
jgi:hypothetical protein